MEDPVIRSNVRAFMPPAKSWIWRELQRFSYEQLELFTDGFHESNYLGKVTATYGKVFRGCMDGRPVIVERWDRVDEENDDLDKDILRVWKSQIEFLTSILGRPPSPILAQPIGYCKQRPILGLVYQWECDSMNTVENMMLDGDFTWKLRIKVALQIARLVAKFCEKPDFSITFRSLEPACIMLDKNFSPLVFDVGGASGAWMGEISHSLYFPGRSDYVDTLFLYQTNVVGPYCDVYSFGAILMSLITKKHGSILEQVAKAAKSKEGGDLPVHQDFLADPEYHDQDGRDIVDLVLLCLNHAALKRPNIHEVVERLERLWVLKNKKEEMQYSWYNMFLPVKKLLIHP